MVRSKAVKVQHIQHHTTKPDGKDLFISLIPGSLSFGCFYEPGSPLHNLRKEGQLWAPSTDSNLLFSNTTIQRWRLVEGTIRIIVDNPKVTEGYAQVASHPRSFDTFDTRVIKHADPSYEFGIFSSSPFHLGASNVEIPTDDIIKKISTNPTNITRTLTQLSDDIIPLDKNATFHAFINNPAIIIFPSAAIDPLSSKPKENKALYLPEYDIDGSVLSTSIYDPNFNSKWIHLALSPSTKLTFEITYTYEVLYNGEKQHNNTYNGDTPFQQSTAQSLREQNVKNQQMSLAAEKLNQSTQFLENEEYHRRHPTISQELAMEEGEVEEGAAGVVPDGSAALKFAEAADTLEAIRTHGPEVRTVFPLQDIPHEWGSRKRPAIQRIPIPVSEAPKSPSVFTFMPDEFLLRDDYRKKRRRNYQGPKKSGYTRAKRR